MNKYPLIGGSICTVVLLVLGSLTNVVGIESAQSCGCGDPPCWPELKGTMGDNNWYICGVSVRFDGSASSVAYRIDGGSWQTYTAEFALSTDGIHLLEWACDFNISNIYSVEIKIDWTPPIASNITSKWLGLFKWQFTINVSDEISGVNRVRFFIDGFIDTEPPYEHIWDGCMLLFWLKCFNLLYRYSHTWNAWDNAGNCYQEPS